MNNACAFLAVASLLLAAVPGRSQDASIRDGTLETKQPAPVAKCLTLQQRMQQWGKLQPVSQAAETPVDTSVLAALPEAVPPAPTALAVSPVAVMGEPCLGGPGRRSFGEQLDDWLTYRHLGGDCCDCCPQPAPCCSPPVYTFFLGNCYVNSTGPGCRAGRTQNFHFLCSCGHRMAALWDDMHNSRLWPGNVDFQVRQRVSGFFFHLGKSCAPGGCLADESIAETETK